MQDNEKNFLFVGSSLTNLLLALKLKKDQPSQKILIIEKDKELGGLYKSFQYENDIKFDTEVRLYTETGDSEIDSLFLSSLDTKDWNILDGSNRSIAGSYFNGILQTNTSYPDLRNIDPKIKQKFLNELIDNRYKDSNPFSYKNCYEFIEAKFGQSLTREIIEPIFQKHFHKNLHELDPIASLVIPVTRVALLDIKELEELLRLEGTLSRVAYPDQFKLPEKFKKNTKLYYPKKFGIDQVIESLVNKLKSYGVEIMVNSYITEIKINDKKIDLARIQAEKHIKEFKVERIFWGAGFGSLSKLLNIQETEKPIFKKAAFVNILLNEAPSMDNLHYCYVFDQGFSIFRCINYSSYCPGAKYKQGYPISLSLWLDKEYSDDEITSLAKSELEKTGILSGLNKVNFIKVERTNAFPEMTIENMKIIRNIKKQILDIEINNLNIVGILSKESLFYQDAILKDAFKQLRSIFKKQKKCLFTDKKLNNIIQSV